MDFANIKLWFRQRLHGLRERVVSGWLAESDGPGSNGRRGFNWEVHSRLDLRFFGLVAADAADIRGKAGNRDGDARLFFKPLPDVFQALSVLKGRFDLRPQGTDLASFSGWLLPAVYGQTSSSLRDPVFRSPRFAQENYPLSTM